MFLVISSVWSLHLNCARAAKEINIPLFSILIRSKTDGPPTVLNGPVIHSFWSFSGFICGLFFFFTTQLEIQARGCTVIMLRTRWMLERQVLHVKVKVLSHRWISFHLSRKQEIKHSVKCTEFSIKSIVPQPTCPIFTWSIVKHLLLEILLPIKATHCIICQGAHFLFMPWKHFQMTFSSDELLFGGFHIQHILIFCEY